MPDSPEQLAEKVRQESPYALNPTQDAALAELVRQAERVEELEAALQEAQRVQCGTALESDERGARANALMGRVEELEAALRQITQMPTEERNPDGDEQAAYSMQAVAQDALAASTEGEK